MKFSELMRMSDHSLRAKDRTPWREEIGVLDFSGSMDADLLDPQYDSRNVKQASTFFAIKGFAEDGHQFIEQAIANGAGAIVLEDATRFPKSTANEKHVHWLFVEDSRRALAYISEEYFGRPS